MMPAGQYISPQTLQALQSISSSQEDSQNLQQQMALAKALRAPTEQTDGSTQMAGKVAIRKSPLSLAASTAQNALSGYEQNQTLQAMQKQAQMLRNARGQIITAKAAIANAQDNPEENHPDTNAALGVPTQDAALGEMSGFPGAGDM